MSKKKKPQIKRTIKLTGTDIELDLSAAVAVKTEKQMIHFDIIREG